MMKLEQIIKEKYFKIEKENNKVIFRPINSRKIMSQDRRYFKLIKGNRSKEIRYLIYQEMHGGELAYTGYYIEMGYLGQIKDYCLHDDMLKLIK